MTATQARCFASSFREALVQVQARARTGKQIPFSSLSKGNTLRSYNSEAAYNKSDKAPQLQVAGPSFYISQRP